VICRAIESAYSKIDTQITNRSSKTSLTQIKEIIEQEIREGIHKK
jgi:predicted DNA-binding protein